jgi:hypothetical protein
MGSILTQMNLIHIHTQYFFKLHFNIILLYKHRSQKCSFHVIRLEFLYAFLNSPLSDAHPTSIILL